MNFVYHGVPDDMRGTKLIPLSHMRMKDPKLAAEYADKYKGRKNIMERRVPLLNCDWNDVVQFLPLHPQKVFRLQKELGLIEEVYPYKFFEIDVSNLDPSKAVVYYKTAPGDENVEVKWLKDVDLKDLQHIPPATRKYYEDLVGTGDLPFNYQFIPHVLYAGELDVSAASTITL